VRNAGTTTDIPRRNLFAFNAATGQVSTGFAPDPNGTVYALESAADEQSVYVGGSFGTITSGGSTVSVSNLFSCRANSVKYRTGTTPANTTIEWEERSCGFSRTHREMVNMPEIGTMAFVGIRVAR
jgi:hypothetical protein